MRSPTARRGRPLRPFRPKLQECQRNEDGRREETRTVQTISAGLVDLVLRAAVEVQLGLLVAKMPEAVPLTAALGVERQDIVVDAPRRLVVDLVHERRAVETRCRGLGQGPVGRDADAVHDFFGGRHGVFGRQAIEHAQLVARAKETPGIAKGPGLVEGQRGK